MKYSLSIILLLVSFLVFTNCTTDKKELATAASHALPVVASDDDLLGFKDYWYQGKAEITSFELEQARYGEIHPGQAVLIFVTEPFSKSKQVKLDNPQRSPKDDVSVLKLNATRKFNTGVYPYSTMQSIFTPVETKQFPNSLKVTTSSQEWCGHTFHQLNLTKNNYQSNLFSYFESEGDQKKNIDKTLLEDEILNRIRINPTELPTGKINIIPSLLFTRLKHIDLKSESAAATLQPIDGNPDQLEYSIQYKNLDRTFSIQFEKAFPHQILGWKESITSGWGANAKTLTTKATRKKTIKLDYWSKNNLEDKIFREELGLE